MVVTWPSTSYHLLCVRVCLLCLVFILVAHHGNKVNYLPVITTGITDHSKFCKVTQTILNPHVPETWNCSNSCHPLFVVVATHLPTLKRLKPEL